MQRTTQNAIIAAVALANIVLRFKPKDKLPSSNKLSLYDEEIHDFGSYNEFKG